VLGDSDAQTEPTSRLIMAHWNGIAVWLAQQRGGRGEWQLKVLRGIGTEEVRRANALRPKGIPVREVAERILLWGEENLM